ncbi:MAG: shikimate kinase [Bacteroidia bacterium]
MESSNHPKFIFLIGFMASGKTTIGRQISSKLNVPFIDLDEVIEMEAGCDIPTIFKTQSEWTFRNLEARCLRQLKSLPEPYYIISVGGGTPCFRGNLPWMKNHGKIAYLDTPLHTIVSRLDKEATEKRPMFANVGPEEKITFIDERWLARQAYYKQADARFRDPETMLEEIVPWILDQNGFQQLSE